MSPETATARGLRIAHLIESDGPGGAEHVVADLASELQRGGAENVAFLPAAGEGWIARQLDGSGVAIELFRIDRPIAPGCVRALAESFRRRRIDIAHSHEFSMAVYGGWAARLAGIPHVITMHGGRYYAGKLRRRLAMRSAVAISARLAAVSASVARDLCRDLGLSTSQVVTIPNGVRPARSEAPALRQELGLGPDARLAVAVGNLYPVKGHQYLIDALARLASHQPALHVAIAGRGDLEAPLRERAATHRVSDRVHLLGLRSDVAAVIAAADVFVMPSISEGLPLALLEAMFAGRPIVATNVGEVAVALAYGRAGVVVPAGDAPALADAIDRLLRDPAAAAALGAHAARHAASEYDLSRMVGRYLGLYRQLRPISRTTEPGQAGGAGTAARR